MVKQFKGIVKIEDVQNEFNSLVNAINNIIDAYNESAYVQDIDYNNVSPELAPMGYTLSVGGLRKILDAYDGCVVGCKVFQMEGFLAITNGLLITRNGGIKLPAAKLENAGDYLFYSPSTQQYKRDEGYSEKFTVWTQPTFTSNESYGSLTRELYSIAPDGRTYPATALNQQFNIFSPQLSGFTVLAGTPSEVGLVSLNAKINWNFRNPLKINSIKITATKLDTIVGNVTFSINKLDGTSLGSQTVAMGNSVTFNLNDIVLDGLQIVASGDKYLMEISEMQVTAEELTKTPVTSNEGDATDWIVICKLNTNRNIALSNTQEFTIGNINNFKIGTQTKNVAWRTPESLNNDSQAQFVSGVEGDQKEGTGRANTYLLGELVAYNQQTGHRNSSCWTVYNKLLIPKKVAMPYTYQGRARTNMTKTFDVVEKRE